MEDLGTEYIIALSELQKKTSGMIALRQVDFGPRVVDGKEYVVAPNTVRFLEEPRFKNPLVYISDIDIITLEEIRPVHLEQMEKAQTNYSNVVRPNSKPPRLTGLHFTKWEGYYPIPDYSDLVKKALLSLDEIFLHDLVAKTNPVDVKFKMERPVHGIHCSPNRIPNAKVGWGLSEKWKEGWEKYRNSDTFRIAQLLFSERVNRSVEIIDRNYFGV